MSEPKFTPGPWKVDKAGVEIGPGFRRFIVCAISPGDGDEILITSRVESDGNENADARLIASAPQLHEAVTRVDALLRDIEEVCLAMPHAKRPRWFRGVQDMIAVTSGAIAKAVGQ